MKYNLLACITLFFSAVSLADGNLTSLRVDSDVVYFTTNEAKTATSPSCMTAENNDKWSISLNSASGKAIYALLVTAAADNRKINVLSAGDCADASGVERAKSVELGVSININEATNNPVFIDVAYAHQYHGGGNHSCAIYVNSNNAQGLAYLSKTSTGYCQCENGSVMVKTGLGSNSSSQYLKCVISQN